MLLQNPSSSLLIGFKDQKRLLDHALDLGARDQTKLIDLHANEIEVWGTLWTSWLAVNLDIEEELSQYLAGGVKEEKNTALEWWWFRVLRASRKWKPGALSLYLWALYWGGRAMVNVEAVEELATLIYLSLAALEVENQLGKTNKSLRSDRGGEYMSSEFLDSFKGSLGIIALYSSLHSQHKWCVGEEKQNLYRYGSIYDESKQLFHSPFGFCSLRLMQHSQYGSKTKKVEKTHMAMNVENAIHERTTKVWFWLKLPPNGKTVGQQVAFRKRLTGWSCTHLKALLGFSLAISRVTDDYEIWQKDVKTASSNGYLMKRACKVFNASAVVSIMYAVRCYCPDVAFAPELTSRFQQNPGDLTGNTLYIDNPRQLQIRIFRGFFEKQKLTGPNFIDWYRQLRIVLSIDDKLNYLEQPLPPAPVAPAGQHVAPEKKKKTLKSLQLILCYGLKDQKIMLLMLMTMEPEIQRNLENLHANDMLKELKALFAQQAEQELLQTTRDFHACKQEEGQSVSSYVLRMKGYIDNLERLGHPVTLGLATVNELHAMLKLHEQTLNLPKNNAPALHAIRAGKVQKGKKHNKPQPSKAGRGQNQGNGKHKHAFAPKPKIPPPPKREDPAKDQFVMKCGGDRTLKMNFPHT
ncbi:hypothetical protein Tco_0027231 [Tanacetum coccineum]